MADASRVVDIVLQVVGKGQGVIKRYVEEFAGMDSAGRAAASGAQSASKSLETLESRLAQVRGFAGLKQSAQDTAETLAKTQKEVAGLARQLSNRANLGEELKKGLDAARNSAAGLDAALARQRTSLTEAKAAVAIWAAEYKKAKDTLEQVKASRDADAASLERANADYTRLGAVLAEARKKQQDIAATIRDTQAAYKEAKRSVADYEAQIGASARAMETNRNAFEAARTEAARLKGVYNEQRQALHQVRQSLSEAGISIRNLAAAQRQLQAEYENVRKVTAARDFLGLRPHQEIRAEIARVQRAYQTLAQSGKLSGKELAQAMSAARQRIRELHAQTESLDKGVKQLGASWQGVVGVMAGMGALTAGMKQFGDFESSMLKVQALTEAQGEQFDALNQKAMDLGATTRYSAGEAAAGMGVLAASGLDAQKILDTIPSALHLAAASGMDVAEAADKVTNIFAQFGSQGTVDHVADVMTAGFTGAATSLQELSDAMVYCGPVANALGYNLEETNAVLMALANNGYKGSMAGTAMRGAMVRLINPTREAQKILEKYGVTIRNTDGTMRSFDKIIDDLKDSGIETSETMALFGQRAGPAMQALLGPGGKAIRDMAEKLEDVDGKAKKVSDHMESGFMGSMRRLLAGVSAIAIAFGESIAPALSAVADKVAELATWISKLPGPMKGVASTIAVAGMGFAVWKAGLGSMVAIVRGLPVLIKQTIQARASTAQLNAELARVGPTATASMGQAGAAATGLSARLRGTAASAGTATAGVSTLSKALGALGAVVAAASIGWAIGEMLNNFDAFRKVGVSVVYSIDRICLAFKKMWAFISGGDVKAVNREIEAAKEAHLEMLEAIDKGEDDWSKKQRGELTTNESIREARANARAAEAAGGGKGGNDQARKDAALAAAIGEEFGGEGGGAEWNAEADARRDRLMAIDEEIADARQAREEKAFDAELARREKLAEAEHGDQGRENERAARLEREKELPEDREKLKRAKAAHDARMAMLDEEQKKAAASGDEGALERIGQQRQKEEDAHEDETARLEHEQRLKYIQLEEEAALAAHNDALARIEREAEARKQAHEQQLADIKAEREEVEAAHEEKMQLLAEELEAARAGGDERAIREAEKNIEREEKGFEKDTARLDKAERKARETEARAKQDDERRKADEDAAYAREQDKLKLKTDKENEEEEERKREREKEREAREAEEQARKEAEAEARAREEAEAKLEAKADTETETPEEKKERKKQKKRERRERRRREAEARKKKREEAARRKEEEERQAEQERAAREQETIREREAREQEAERGRSDGERKAAETLEGLGKEIEEAGRAAAKMLSEMEDAFDQARQAAFEAADAEVAALEDAARAAEESAKEWEDSQRQAAEEAAKSVEEYYDRLKKASEEVADRQKSLSEELLELDTTKSEKQKWQILARQAKEYEKQAREALKAGDLEKAKELADLARSSYGRLKGGAEGVDEKRAQRQTYAGVRSAGELGIAIARLQEAQAGQAARKQANIAAGLNRVGPAVKQAETIVQEKQTIQQAQLFAPPKTQVDRVHELRFSGGALRGGEEDIEALLRQLERAGMTA